MTQPQFFSDLPIEPKFLERLAALGFEKPSPIQAQAIPIAAEGSDLVGIAQTGTGKTMAFGVPMIQRLAASSPTAAGLVLLPTRELAEQVELELRKISPRAPMALLIGGAGKGGQLAQLARNPAIVIATPGRLIDFMGEKKISLENIEILVLDEADRMLDMGFAPQINRILATLPTERQTLLFSATMPAEIARIAAKFMKTPLRVEVAPAGTASERVAQELLILPQTEKLPALEKTLAGETGAVLVFTRTKYGAAKLARAVRAMGHRADEIHGDRSLPQRRRALADFKSGKISVLVATDVAARGIDVSGIELVVQFDLPTTPDDYVHRIGRTGRGGAEGRAVAFATPAQAREVGAIERLLKNPIPRAEGSATLPTQTGSGGTRSKFRTRRWGR